VWLPFNLKIIVGYFQTKTREINHAANRRSTPLFIEEKHAVRGLFALLIGDDAPKVNKIWPLPTYFFLHLGCMDSLRCSLSVIHPK
jgi:hypothetical protein